MSPDVIDGYLQAGRTLSPLGEWGYGFVATFGPGVIFVGVMVGGWGAIRSIGRRVRAWWRGGNDQVANALADTPASSAADDLRTCMQILDATDNQTRKEKPQR